MYGEFQRLLVSMIGVSQSWIPSVLWGIVWFRMDGNHIFCSGVKSRQRLLFPALVNLSFVHKFWCFTCWTPFIELGYLFIAYVVSHLFRKKYSFTSRLLLHLFVGLLLELRNSWDKLFFLSYPLTRFNWCHGEFRNFYYSFFRKIPF